MYRVLVVDDTRTTVSYLNQVLGKWGYDVMPAYDGEEALSLFKAGSFDLILTDIRMGAMNGVDLLHQVRQQNADIPVIMISGYQDIGAAAEALKAGAFDYIEKPFQIHDLVATMNRALAYGQALHGALDLMLVVGFYHRCGDVVAESVPMREICAAIQREAPAETSVLLAGENGTGRALIARTIHDTGPRHDKPFVAVGCGDAATAQTPPDWQQACESAHNGTLFLRNVHRLPPAEQNKCMATIRNMREAAADKDPPAPAPRLLASCGPANAPGSAILDPDLAAELSPSRLEVPPLRQRRADILPLVYHLLVRHLGKTEAIPRLDIGVCMSLEQHDWPGNVAEVEDMVRSVLTHGRPATIHKDVLPDALALKAGNISPPREADLKSEFLFGQGLKRFVSGKGKDQVDRLLESVRLAPKHPPAEQARPLGRARDAGRYHDKATVPATTDPGQPPAGPTDPTEGSAATHPKEEP
jgi:DNA-binding NtrC family response regulator